VEFPVKKKGLGKKEGDPGTKRAIIAKKGGENLPRYRGFKREAYSGNKKRNIEFFIGRKWREKKKFRSAGLIQARGA